MAPLVEAKALAALLRALSTVGFVVSGAFWVSRCQRVACGGWRIANGVVQSWNSLPQRPEQHPKAADRSRGLP
jgi:hypothetical protein